VGRVDATARIMGLLSDPTVTVETNSGSVTWSDMRVSDIKARGSYRRGQLSLTTAPLDFAGGDAEGPGGSVLDDARPASPVDARGAPPRPVAKSPSTPPAARAALKRGGRRSTHGGLQAPQGSPESSRRMVLPWSNGAPMGARDPRASTSTRPLVWCRPPGQFRWSCRDPGAGNAGG